MRNGFWSRIRSDPVRSCFLELFQEFRKSIDSGINVRCLLNSFDHDLFNFQLHWCKQRGWPSYTSTQILIIENLNNAILVVYISYNMEA